MLHAVIIFSDFFLPSYSYLDLHVTVIYNLLPFSMFSLEVLFNKMFFDEIQLFDKSLGTRLMISPSLPTVLQYTV